MVLAVGCYIRLMYNKYNETDENMGLKRSEISLYKKILNCIIKFKNEVYEIGEKP